MPPGTLVIPLKLRSSPAVLKMVGKWRASDDKKGHCRPSSRSRAAQQPPQQPVHGAQPVQHPLLRWMVLGEESSPEGDPGRARTAINRTCTHGVSSAAPALIHARDSAKPAILGLRTDERPLGGTVRGRSMARRRRTPAGRGASEPRDHRARACTSRSTPAARYRSRATHWSMPAAWAHGRAHLRWMVLGEESSPEGDPGRVRTPIDHT